MLTAITKKGDQIAGWEANKENSYFCPACSEPLTLRQGDIKIHHFSHVAESTCVYGTGESEQHLLMKKLLYKKFLESNLYKEISLECKIGERIADIYMVNTRKQKIAVECQISELDIKEFKRRTAYYSYRGIYTVWIFSGNKDLEKRLLKLVQSHGSRLSYSTNELERKCHRWFYGRIYYFYNDSIHSIHFHPIEQWMPSACDECLDQINCPYQKPAQCPKYRPGYIRFPKILREVSIYPVNNIRLMCVDRKDKLRIAKFNEPAWWKV